MNFALDCTAMMSVVMVCSTAFAVEGPASSPARAKSSGATFQPAGASLRIAAEERGILFGAAVVGLLLQDEQSPYARTVARQCAIVTPENNMKFGFLRPTSGTWNWSEADTIVEFAERRGIKVHGHTLLWYKGLPAWVTEAKRSPAEVRELMLSHIETVAGRWRGKIHAWDVVNEVINKEGEIGGSYWKDALGDEYIDMAYRKVREVDPKALLVYNDYDIETPGKKADGVYKLIKGMKERGVPIDAVGLQSHFASDRMPSISDLRAAIERFRELGVQVWITELDIRIKSPATSEKLARQAEQYGNLMRMYVETGAVQVVQTWGVEDGHSWVPHFAKGYTDALLFDRDVQPKPAYWAVLKALESHQK